MRSGVGSSRTTPTRRPISAGSTSGSAGARGPDIEPRGLYPFLTTLLPRRRTASGSCTAPPSPTCSAGCASGPPERPWQLIAELIWAADGGRARRRPAADGLGAAVHDGGCAPPRATWPGSGSCCWTAAPSRTVTAARRRVVPPRWLRRRWAVGRRRAIRLRRVAGRAGLSGRLVPQPVLVPPGHATATCCSPGHPRPDAARQPAHPHGVREVLHLAAGPEPAPTWRTRCGPSTPSAACCRAQPGSRAVPDWPGWCPGLAGAAHHATAGRS